MYVKLFSHSTGLLLGKVDRESSLDALVLDTLSEVTERIICSEQHLFIFVSIYLVFVKKEVKDCHPKIKKAKNRKTLTEQRRAVFHTGVFS